MVVLWRPRSRREKSFGYRRYRLGPGRPALVMLMTPALGFFYGGLVRQKNVLSTIMHSFFILALISVQWVLWGYTLAFGPTRAASSAASTGSA